MASICNFVDDRLPKNNKLFNLGSESRSRFFPRRLMDDLRRTGVTSIKDAIDELFMSPRGWMFWWLSNWTTIRTPSIEREGTEFCLLLVSQLTDICLPSWILYISESKVICCAQQRQQLLPGSKLHKFSALYGIFLLCSIPPFVHPSTEYLRICY